MNLEELEPYRKIYTEFEQIIGQLEYNFGLVVKKQLDEDKFNKIKEYISNKAKEDLNAGQIRTLLMLLKPYKDNEILSDSFKFLIYKYKQRTNRDIC